MKWHFWRGQTCLLRKIINELALHCRERVHRSILVILAAYLLWNQVNGVLSTGYGSVPRSLILLSKVPRFGNAIFQAKERKRKIEQDLLTFKVKIHTGIYKDKHLRRSENQFDYFIWLMKMKIVWLVWWASRTNKLFEKIGEKKEKHRVMVKGEALKVGE